MRLLHYLEIQNFKRFGAKQRIELDHPAVLTGPNNCGKTTAVQAIALWSQAVTTWFDSKGKAPPTEPTSTSLNRLSIVSVPVQRTRELWHNMDVRTGNQEIPLLITLGVLHENEVVPVTMRFRNHGDDLVYCTPDEASLARPEVIATAAELDVELVYPMVGIETEEPVLRPGRVKVLLGQGRTGQVLRNLCLSVSQNAPEDWLRIVELIERLFSIDLGAPGETARGSIELSYRQPNLRDPADVALAGHGLHQVLFMLAYLYSHRRSVLLVDGPDAHLELVRQKQLYVLLKEIASRNESQAVIATHSDVVLEEARERNLTLLVDGQATDIAARPGIHSALRKYGSQHCARARQTGYVLYVEEGTDLDILRALAKRLQHPVAETLNGRINAFYVRSRSSHYDLDSELERLEGNYGVVPKEHFEGLKSIFPDLRGLAILGSDGKRRLDVEDNGLQIVYWSRRESENYFVTPTVLKAFVDNVYEGAPLFAEHRDEILDGLVRARVFGGRDTDFARWQELSPEAGGQAWDLSTKDSKVSEIAEEYFRRLGAQMGQSTLLTKNDLHRLVAFVDPVAIPGEVSDKLDLVDVLVAHPGSRRRVSWEEHVPIQES